MSDRYPPSRRRFFTPVQQSCNCEDLDYKNVELLRRYIGENGKIRPRRQTGLCAKCQRKLGVQVKRARHLALLPFTSDSFR